MSRSSVGRPVTIPIRASGSAPPLWLKALVGVLCAFEAVGITADVVEACGRARKGPPTISVLVGRQPPPVRYVSVASLVVGLFLHLAPAVLGWLIGLFVRHAEEAVALITERIY